MAAKRVRVKGPGASVAGRPPADELQLPELDRDAIRERETRDVQARLEPYLPKGWKEGTQPTAQQLAAAEKAAAMAAGIADEAQAEADRLRKQRDHAALSLALNDGVRAMFKVIGVNYSRWVRVRREATAGGGKVRRYPNAAEAVVRLAEQVASLEARADAALEIRDQMLLRLAVDAGQSYAHLAELIGKTARLVAQRVIGLLWDQVRAEEDTCSICGEPIDKTLPSKRDEAFTVVYEVPPGRDQRLARDRHNMRAAHRECARSAGAQEAATGR